MNKIMLEVLYILCTHLRLVCFPYYVFNYIRMANVHSHIDSEIFSLEDCEALLNFPYHEYSTDEITDLSESEIDYFNPNSFQNATINSFDSALNLPDPCDIVDERNDVVSNPEIRFNNTNYLDNSASDFLLKKIKRKALSYDYTIENKCLSINLSLQKKLQEALNIVQIALETNLTKQEEYVKIQQEIERRKIEQKGCKKSTGLFANPYFRDIKKMVPPVNEDTIEKMKRNDLTAHHRPPKPWHPDQLRRLTKGVEASALNVAIKPYVEKRDYLITKMRNENLSENEVKPVKMQIEKLEKEIDNQSKRSTTELIKEVEGKLDWMMISSQYLNGNKSDFECEIMWNNCLSIFVNKNPFTEVEDSSLQRLVKKYKEKNWDAIAKELNSDRTAIQCFERYQNCFKKKFTKRFWTPKDDEKLKKIINLFRRGNYIPWQRVLCYMGGWSYNQIVDRYSKVLREDIRRAKFSVEEDAMIIACTKVFGSKFTEMKQFLPGRAAYVIKKRYFNHLDPAIKLDEWTEEEDVKLIELFKEHGNGNWKEIAQYIPGRTTYMCMKRIKSLQYHRSKMKKKSGKDLDLHKVIPSNIRLLENMRLVQSEAKQVLQTALENIRSKIQDNIYECLDLPNLSKKELKMLHKELFKDFNDDSTKHYVPRYVCGSNFISSESDEEEVFKESDDDDDDTGTFLCESESTLTKVEKLWLHEALHSRLREDANLILSGMAPKKRSWGETTYRECEYYTNFLRKKFLCCKNSEEEKSNQKEDEFQHSILKAIKFLNEPGAEENKIIALCPNFATASAFEIIETTKERLERISSFVDQSKPYLAYLMGYIDKKPKCSKCKVKKGKATQEVLENVLRSMQDRFLIVDENLQKSAEVEVGFSSTSCKCNELVDSKESFSLLQKRFLSIFLWPSLLSSTELNPEQEKLVIQHLCLRSKTARKRVRMKNNSVTDKQPCKKLIKRSKRNYEVLSGSECQASTNLDTSSFRRSCRIFAKTTKTNDTS